MVIFIIINIIAIINKQPISTGKSYFSRLCTTRYPIPFQSKTYSTNTEPASKEANQLLADVTTGFREFFRMCLKNILFFESPFAFAVLTKSLFFTSKIEFRDKLVKTASGRIDNVNAGNIKFFNDKYSPRPRSSTSYRLPNILSPVISPSTHAKSQAISTDAKNEGTDMPSTLITIKNLSVNFPCHLAYNEPNIKPKAKANIIEVKARMAVAGKAALITCVTGCCV